MVKHLLDLCIEVVAGNLHCITGPSRYLAVRHKEKILEHLINHDNLTKEYLPHVTYNLFTAGLRTLTLCSDQVTDNLLCLLRDCKCKFENLVVYGCVHVTDLGLVTITDGQDELKHLKLQSLKNITDRGLSHIESKHLKTVNIRKCQSITPEAVKTLCVRNPSISHLNVSACHGLDEPMFDVIAASLNVNLESLDVSDQRVFSDVDVLALATHCPNLKELLMIGCNRVSSDSLKNLLEKCPKLSNLDISYCSQLQSQGHCDIFQLFPPSITELSLSGLRLEDKTNDILVESLKRLPKLSSIKLCGVSPMDDEMLDLIFKHIGKTVTHIDMSGCTGLTDASVKPIAKYCVNLEELVLSLIYEVTGETLLPIFQDRQRAANILHLNLGCRKLSPSVLLEVVNNCVNLKSFRVPGVGLVDDMYIKLVANNCRSLEIVNVKSCVKVTDDGICELGRTCPQLKIAIFSGLRTLTDKSVLAIANNCHYLEEVYLSGCSGVTTSAVDYLRKCCIPRVYVLHVLGS